MEVKTESYKPKAGEWFEWRYPENNNWWRGYCIGYSYSGDIMFAEGMIHEFAFSNLEMRPVKAELEELMEVIERHVLEDTGYRITVVDPDKLAKMAQAVLDSGFTKKEK